MISNLKHTQVPFKAYYTVVYDDQSNPPKIGEEYGIPYTCHGIGKDGQLLLESMLVPPELEKAFEDAFINTNSAKIVDKTDENKYKNLKEYFLNLGCKLLK